MKTFKEYLIENYSYDRNIENPFPRPNHEDMSKLSFRDIGRPYPHPNYYEWICDFIVDSFPHLQISHYLLINNEVLLSVLDNLLHNKYMDALKILHVNGARPKSLKDSGTHSVEVRNYNKYLKKLGSNKFGTYIPGAVLPIIPIDRERLIKLYDYGMYYHKSNYESDGRRKV